MYGVDQAPVNGLRATAAGLAAGGAAIVGAEELLKLLPALVELLLLDPPRSRRS